MLLTNLGAAEGKNNSTRYKRKLKDWKCTKEGKTKILCLGTWFNTISWRFKSRHALCLLDHVTCHVVCRHSFISEPVREKDWIIILLTAHRTDASSDFLCLTLLYFILLYFTLLYILLPLESKQCPLTLASVLACAGPREELRFGSNSET